LQYLYFSHYSQDCFDKKQVFVKFNLHTAWCRRRGGGGFLIGWNVDPRASWCVQHKLCNQSTLAALWAMLNLTFSATPLYPNTTTCLLSHSSSRTLALSHSWPQLSHAKPKSSHKNFPSSQKQSMKHCVHNPTKLAINEYL